MKNLKTTVLYATLIITAMIGTTSCNSNKTEDTKEVAEDSNDEKFKEKDNEKDAQFLVNAAELSMEEVSLGKLAQEKSKLTYVKELGKMMEEDHTQYLAAVTALAQTKSITLPTSATEDALEAYTNLNKKTDNEFAKDYCDKMVKGHKDAIDFFEKASTESNDADIKAWALEMLPKLRTHLDQSILSQTEADKLKK
jgi:putative membrane protein